MSDSMIVIGEKESFIVRVLVQKAQAAGCETSFVGWNINKINEELEKATLVTLYLDDYVLPHDDVLHFLTDKMQEKSLEMILIGEQVKLDTIEDYVPKELIYESFSRPVNNDEYVKAVMGYFSKMAAGDFKKSILIVDDDAQYLTMVREWLRGTYKVSMANSGMQAIKWLAKNKVDLILLDHEMPITTGPQVLEMLRSEDETKNIPVMFLTGKGDKESVMAVVALKPEGYFLKSIDRAELLEKLNEFFIMHG
ncbi:response regulator [Butyrivibrio sp. VCD2006]|uniref:response regulator n=1 Tax=Butyrivibrio sp. VCD2006 TaxID=1280664 RepID=UPI0004164BC9|nr:response regulator [Butyrivibrio sp. VCD2006]